MSWKKDLKDERDHLQNEDGGKPKHAGKGGDHEVVYTCSFKVDQILIQ